MDPNYNINGFSGSSDAQPHSYSTPQNSSTSQRFPDQMQESNTLPPIGAIPNQPYPQPFYSHPGSMPQTPITPQTPLQPASSAPSNPNAYSQMPHQPGPPRTLQPNPPHLPPVSSFSNPPSIHTPPSTTLAQPSYYASNALGGRGLSDIRPRPDGIFPHLASQPNTLSKQPDPEPTHVVGQQGRRGILPSAPGRAPPGSAKSIVPIKDADGKFPCPHCSKTYLHAKHLKRHMLRHTGDRPYQCKLCKDTFSRSDILKRHFQKCSVRRGAPPDGDHLEGARVHQNKNRLSQSSVNDQPQYLNNMGAPVGFDPNLGHHMMGGIPGFMPNQSMQGHGVPGQNLPEQSAYNDNMASISNRTSRSSSLIQPASSLGENRRSLSSLEHISSRTSFDGTTEFGSAASLPGGLHGLPAYSIPTSVQSAGPLGNHGYGFSSQATNGEINANQAATAGDTANGMFGRPNMPNGQAQEMGWNGNYPTSNPGYPMYQAGQVGGSNQAIKTETNLLESGMSGNAENAEGNAEGGRIFTSLYSNSSTFASNHLFDGWDIGDPFEHKATALVSFCFPGQTAQPTADELRLKAVLTPDNARHFFKLFSNFQGHWPMIHMPTFSPVEAYDGLVLTMVTIGAIYSDRLDLHTQRWFMEQVQRAVQRSSRVYNGQRQSVYGGFDDNHSDLEEIQALLMLQIAFTWHGNDIQRSSSRDNFFRLASIARQRGLLQPLSPEQPGFSILHYEGKRFDDSDRALWQWSTWVEQEKRLRTMYLIYLLDIALVMYFNCQPQLDWLEIKLPLPCDDAAWEARTGADCTDALGLNGPAAQEMCNTTGSRRPKQIPFVYSVKALLNQTMDFQPRSTNAYSKFILIHALHAMIWTAQRQASSSVAAAATFGNLSGSGPNTPISQSDWVSMDPISTLSNTPSGRATPEMVGQHSAQHQQTIRQLTNAVEKWKRNWDRDMEIQYPTTTTPGGSKMPPRTGFCRDGVHFYFLAMLFLTSNRAIDSQIPADHRFTFVMQKLKAIRNYVKNEAYQHGKGIGSVADIQEEYGVEDLTLDMKLLFAPLELNDTESTATFLPQ